MEYAIGFLAGAFTVGCVFYGFVKAYIKDRS